MLKPWGHCSAPTKYEFIVLGTPYSDENGDMGMFKTISLIGIHDAHFHTHALSYVACVGLLQITLWSV